MTIVRVLISLMLVAGATAALVPLGMLGAVYAVLVACVLLVLVPMAIERLWAVDPGEVQTR